LKPKKWRNGHEAQFQEGKDVESTEKMEKQQ